MRPVLGGASVFHDSHPAPTSDLCRGRIIPGGVDIPSSATPDRMRPRYACALADILQMLPEEGEVSGNSLAPSISEVKGLINRCLRKDQSDWLTAYEALGRPEVDATDGGDAGPAPPCSARRG